MSVKDGSDGPLKTEEIEEQSTLVGCPNRGPRVETATKAVFDKTGTNLLGQSQTTLDTESLKQKEDPNSAGVCGGEAEIEEVVVRQASGVEEKKLGLMRQLSFRGRLPTGNPFKGIKEKLSRTISQKFQSQTLSARITPAKQTSCAGSMGGTGEENQSQTNDDLRTEMLHIKMTLCTEGYVGQKFAFNPKVNKSREVCVQLREKTDKITGMKDYLLFWSKDRKAFSIMTDLKSITRGWDSAPVLKRNHSNLRQFAEEGKFPLKKHCISFHFRNRSLDLVFENAQNAESLEKFVNFVRANGSL